MRRWIQKLVVVLATGYILFFFSERVFWSFLRPGDKPADFVLGWLVYSLLAWIFLLLVRQCRVASFPAVFLAGAVYGWMDEGVVVDTLYGSADGPFPSSISFTGLAWHALISVGIGWYWQGKVLRAGKSSSLAIFSVAVGLGWGLWAGWWPAELDKTSTSLVAFATHTVVCSVLLVLAWAVLGLVPADCFRPGKWERVALFGIVALFFVGVRIPATPRSVLILPPLLVACACGLNRNRLDERRPDLVETFVGHTRPQCCLWLLLAPVTAIAVYAPVAVWRWTLPTNKAVYMTTMPLGFILFVLSLWLICRARRHPAPHPVVG